MKAHIEEAAVPGHGKLAVKSAVEDQAVTVSLSGELDLASAHDLEQALTDAQATNAGRVVIDLAGLEFIDSTGLRVLLSAQRRADATGQALLLRNPQPQVRRLFEIAGILELVSLDGG